MPTQTIDLGYQPRPQQVAIHRALESHRWVVAVCHRRMGKTVAAVHHLVIAALECPRPRPRFAYIAPTYRQAKLIAWDYLKAATRPLPLPEDPRESDLIINLPNGARIQLFGADNPDALRGQYFDGAVFDEYGLQPANVFSEVVRPALADRLGWALFLGTPNGRNQFSDAAAQAQRGGEWAYLEFRASETGIIPEGELQSARALMTDDEYRQEFECSFEAAVRGAIYGKELETARTEGRIGTVPVDPLIPVETYWDLGVGDATAIWFVQSPKTGEIRVVDFYEASGEGLPHYAAVLERKGYRYGRHVAPHDIQVRELGSGRSRLEAARALGIRFDIAPDMGVEDGIHAARMLLPRCYFDATRCEAGIEALKNYRRDYNTRLNEFKATPVHDWACVTGDTKVLTRSGMHVIQSLPSTGEVWTSCGWKRYENPRITRRAAPLVAVTFDDGLTVKCTPEHRFLTDSGWRFAANLQPGSQIRSALTRSRSILMAVSTACGRKNAILRAVASVCTAMCGKRLLARFLWAATSIIATVMHSTTRWRTWNASLPLNIWAVSGSGCTGSALSISPLPRVAGLPSGIGLRLGAHGTDAMLSAHRAGRNGVESPSRASIAARLYRRLFGSRGIARSIAPTRAKRLRIAAVASLMETADVWCLTVPDGHMWSLANGAITHNSHASDAWRYLAVAQKPAKERVRVGLNPVYRTGGEGAWLA